MKIAYLLFDGITWLDLVGLYDPLSRLRSQHYLPDLSWKLCAFGETAADNFGLSVKASQVKGTLQGFDVIVVPGGWGTRELLLQPAFIDWLKTASPAATKVSVCTGSLLLGAAGFLRGKKATTNFAEYETLKPYCGEVLAERIVEDGEVITAGAVSASLDLGLYLCRKWAGEEAEREIRKRMDYRG